MTKAKFFMYKATKEAFLPWCGSTEHLICRPSVPVMK